MRITQWGEYGVHCCVYLARKHAEGMATVGAAEIAKGQNIAIEYAQQILQKLRRGSIIESVRGSQGGYRLTRPATEITLFDILMAAEGHAFELICETKPLSPGRCADSTPCSLRPLWHDFREHVNSFLTGHTLDEIVSRSSKMDAPIQIGSRARNSRAS